MKHGWSSKTHWTAQDGGAGEMLFARFEHDRFVERAMLPAIAFAEKDPQQKGVAGNFILIPYSGSESEGENATQPNRDQAARRRRARY